MKQKKIAVTIDELIDLVKDGSGMFLVNLTTYRNLIRKKGQSYLTMRGEIGIIGEIRNHLILKKGIKKIWKLVPKKNIDVTFYENINDIF